MSIKYLLKRKRCKNCKKLFVRLINNEYCIVCYQAKYYKEVTKKKRKKKNREKQNLAWWMNT